MKKRIEFTKRDMIVAKENLRAVQRTLPAGKNATEKELEYSLKASLDIATEAIDALMAICEGRVIRAGETVSQTKRYIISPNKEEG